ncbi:MAG: hypothetical protein HY906_22945 [Deltaproteobacteria bacterium]|nr:hypothetical protein [Deltaproteobacteria bacterium]
MRKSSLVGLVAILGAWPGCGSQAEKIPARFLVGYAEVDVTPPVGTIMGGYGPPGGFRRATGTHDPLLAQVAVIANDADQAYDMGRILADAVEAALPSLEPSQSFQIRHRVGTTECEILSELVKAGRENMHIPPRRMRQ